MAQRKITGSGIAPGSITTENLDNSVNDTIDNVLVDAVLTGDSVTMPTGDANTRPTGTPGMMRYNTDTGLMENYNGSGWQGIDAPPTVVDFTGIINEDTSSTLTIQGSSFKSGTVVYIEGDAVGGIPRPLVTTYINSTQLTVNTNSSNNSYLGGQNFNIRVLNPSGLAATIENAGAVDRDPVWNSPAAGSSTNVYDRKYGAEYSTYVDGGTTYRVVTFKGGAGTWTSPINGTADILIVGGGGGGGSQVGGGGGAGGVLYGSGVSLTSGQSLTYSVGAGGNGGGFTSDNGYASSSGTPGNKCPAGNGFDSYLGSWIAKGGGAGANHDTSTRFGNNDSAYDGLGQPGGSGGGGAGDSSSRSRAGGSSNQSTFTGFTSYGNSGGTGRAGNWAGGGGGGAGAAGANSPSDWTGGDGGIGVQFDITGISTYYAGGGGGCYDSNGHGGGPTNTVSGGGGRGCGNNCFLVFGTYHGEDGQPNTGGGGGGTRDRTGEGGEDGGNYTTRAGNGGSGIIVIRYDISLEDETLLDLDATDPDGDTVTFSTSSTLPDGVTLSTDLKGFPASVSADTTYPLIVNADSNGQSEPRSFNIVLNKTLDGSAPDRAASSASAIQSLTGTTEDGIYWINVNGTPTEVNCDMSTNGGGWMQTMNINTRDGHIVHYVNNEFWESSTETTSFYSAAAGVGSIPQSRPNGVSEWLQDWKAISQGNLWANYSGTEIMVVVHTNGNYLGWKSWNLNTNTVTKFGEFWTGGSSYLTTANPSGGNGYVKYQRRITNGVTASSTSGLNSNEPICVVGADLIANALNYNFDLNRLTKTVNFNEANSDSSGGTAYPVGDNAGGGLGCYYDRDAGGRPECDGQMFNTATWSTGRIGTDALDDNNWSDWNGKSVVNNSTFNWNGTSGYDYDYAFFIR